MTPSKAATMSDPNRYSNANPLFAFYTDTPIGAARSPADTYVPLTPPEQTEDGTTEKSSSPYPALPESLTVWRRRVLNALNVPNSDEVHAEHPMEITTVTSDGAQCPSLSEAGEHSDTPSPSSLGTLSSVVYSPRYTHSECGSSVSEAHEKIITLTSDTSTDHQTSDASMDRPISEDCPTTIVEADFAPDETYEFMRSYRPLPEKLEAVVLPTQCSRIERLVARGSHLAALVQALQDSSDFAFGRRRSELFETAVRVYGLGAEHEALGASLRFKKRLSLDFRKFIARELLDGMLVRYPSGSFPRTFWVTEGEENPVVLLVHDAVGRGGVYEPTRRVHDAVVGQLLDDLRYGGRITGVLSRD